MANISENPWKKLKSEIVYKNKWYTVRRDKVITPDGKPGEYNVVEAADGVFIIPFDENQNVYLIKKFRYPTDTYLWEVPAGGIGDEEPLEAAKRELQEETGLIAQEWRALGKFQAENAYINHFGYVFIATRFHQGTHNDQVAEGIKDVKKVPLKKALKMIQAGEITDSQSITALSLVALDLGYLH